jgi:hypothetical protein
MLVAPVAATFQNHGFVILVVTGALLTFGYRAYIARSTPANIPLVREKLGKKNFGFLTRMLYYFDCSSLYGDAWHKVSAAKACARNTETGC